MRIAVLADVHGNIHALEAAAEDIQKEKVDLTIVAGDLVNGLPSSKQCLDLVKEQKMLFLRGNHERYVYDYDSRNPLPLEDDNFAPVRWVKERLSNSDIKLLKELPMFAQFDNLLVTHAAPRDDYFALKNDTPAAEIEAVFAGFEEQDIIRAHHHRWINRKWKGRTLLSIGALGLPMEGKREAAYVIASKQSKRWQIKKHLVSYDFDAAMRSFESSGYLDFTPMAHLSRQELLESIAVVYPFILQWMARKDSNLKLATAIQRFLKTGSIES